MTPLLEHVQLSNSRVVVLLTGLVLLVKRSPKQVEGLAAQTMEWLEQIGRFSSDPENAVGMVLVLAALRWGGRRGKLQLPTAKEGSK